MTMTMTIITTTTTITTTTPLTLDQTSRSKRLFSQFSGNWTFCVKMRLCWTPSLAAAVWG
jgi:hypothetical protein